MRKIILDGEKMGSPVQAHRCIKEALNLPAYYGENLDALWDILSTIGQLTEIEIRNNARLKKNLGEYGEALLRVFQAAAEDNHNLIVTIGG